MSGSLEEAYVAVERAYGQGEFAAALQQATALQPQVPAGRPDLLDQRLQLLIGHIHLYGLNQPSEAANAYSAVLANCQEPSYRDLANQGLELSRQHMPARAEQASPAVSPAASVAVAQPTGSGLPATPWLSQLQDPQQALRDIQQAQAAMAAPPAAVQQPIQPADGVAASPWGGQPAAVEQGEPPAEASPEPAAAQEFEAPEPEVDEEPASALAVQAPEPDTATDGEAAGDPEAIIPVVVTVEEESSEPEPVVATAEAEEPAPAAAPSFSDEEWADLARGLLLVQLSSTAEAPPR